MEKQSTQTKINKRLEKSISTWAEINSAQQVSPLSCMDYYRGYCNYI